MLWLALVGIAACYKSGIICRWCYDGLDASVLKGAGMGHATRALAVALILGGLALDSGTEVRAQALEEVTPTVSISRGFDSWSLFLICNPAWLVENGDRGIGELFSRYKAFGDAIGPKNLAIWFWKKRGIPTADNTDVSRSSEYCGRYKLLPSDAPYVLVTTHHPDEPSPKDFFVMRLNGLNGQDSARALAKLTDQIVLTGLKQSELDWGTRWQRLLTATSAALKATGCYFNKVSFSFKTSVFTAEIEHSATENGGGC